MKSDTSCSIDRFLDYREIGIDGVRAKIEIPFDWNITIPQTEYHYREHIPVTIRRDWHPLINQFYLYWRSKSDELRAIPDWSDLDPPLEAPTLCPYLCQFEDRRQLGEQTAWFCRIMGTHTEEALGLVLTGRYSAAITVDPDHPQAHRFARVVDGGMISYRCGAPRTPVQPRFGRVASIYLPVTDRKRGVNVALGAAIYEWLRG